MRSIHPEFIMPFIVVHVRVSQRRTNDTRALICIDYLFSAPAAAAADSFFGFCFLLRVNMIINLLDDWNRRHGTFFCSLFQPDGRITTPGFIWHADWLTFLFGLVCSGIISGANTVDIFRNSFFIQKGGEICLWWPCGISFFQPNLFF